MNAYKFNQVLSIPNYTIEIDTAAAYGYWQNESTGTEGGLWFSGRELVDYDGVYQLPGRVDAALVAAGYITE